MKALRILKLKVRKIFHRATLYAQRVHLNERHAIPLYLYLKILFTKLFKDNLNGKAMSVAFSLTLSIFPTILFFLALLPYTPINRVQILEVLSDAIPLGIYGFIESTINDILSNKRNQLLSLSVLFALYAATSGIATLIRSFNISYKYAEKRSFLKTRLIAVLLTMVLGLMIAIAVVLLIVGGLSLDWISGHTSLPDTVTIWGNNFLRYGVVIFIFFMSISFIYYLIPSSKKRWSFFSFGSITATSLIILATNAFSYYLDHFATYNKLYGSIGTIIALMLWVYLIAFILLLGLEMNASWQEAIEQQNYRKNIRASEEIRRAAVDFPKSNKLKKWESVQ